MFTAPGKFESVPVVENMEVAAAAGSGGGHSNDGLSSHADRKRMAMGGPSGRSKTANESRGAGASDILDGPDLDGKHVVLLQS
jgi:hypothetical protein